MKEYVNLEMPSILGMGSVGPTLSVLTATVCAAFGSILGSYPAAYPLIMLVLSALLAVFPTVKSGYKTALKLALYPVVTVVIFASAWGVNTGLSFGEDALSKAKTQVSGLSFVGSAYAGDGAVVPLVVKTNKVELSDVDFSTKTQLDQNLYTNLPKGVWSLGWEGKESVYLRDGDGKWWGYLLKKKDNTEQKGMKGGFFRRF